MVFTSIVAIIISFLVGLYCYTCTKEIGFSVGMSFLGILLGLLGGFLICLFVNIGIINEQHVIEQKNYELIEIEIASKNFIGSKYIKEQNNGKYTVYINENNILKEATISERCVHRIISGKPFAVKNIYDFKSKFCKFLFDFDDIKETYECYIPMEPLTSS